MKAFWWGVAAGYVLHLFVPASVSVRAGSSRADRPPGMTGGGPGWFNNPGL